MSGVLASDQTWIQSVAVGQRKIFLSVPGGAGWQHVSSCQAQRLISEVISWVGAACSEVAPSIRSRQCCNPVTYHSVLVFKLPLAAGIDLTECKYDSLTFFFFGRIPCQIAKQFGGRTSDLAEAIIVVFFLQTPGKLVSFLMVVPGGIYFILLLFSWLRHRANLAFETLSRTYSA